LVDGVTHLLTRAGSQNTHQIVSSFFFGIELLPVAQHVPLALMEVVLIAINVVLMER